MVASLARSQLLRCATGDCEPAEWLGCAELLECAGETDAARLLFDVADLRTGMSPMWLHAQRTRQSSWQHASTAANAPAPDVSEPRNTMFDRAIAELASVLAVAPSFSAAPTLPAAPLPRVPQHHDAPPALDGEWVRDCHRLVAALQSPSLAASELEAVFAHLDATLWSLPRFVYHQHVGLSLRALATAVAFEALLEWIGSIRHLAIAPFGSAAVLYAAARCEDAVLGPYFTRVSAAVRSPRELIALAKIAAESTRRGSVGAQVLTALLSQSLRSDQQLDLVDLLADRGEIIAIHGVAVAAVNRAAWRRDEALLWRCRDVALDLGAPRLATWVQHQVAATAPDNALEFTVLGEVAASAGDADAAEAAFVRSLSLQPDRRACRERLLALRRNRFAPFLVDRGFGSTKARAHLRRRQMSPARVAATPRALEIRELTAPLRQFRTWLTEHALPIWATLGFDPVQQRFRERLDFQGRPIDVPHRAMVQARQIYVFAHAARLGWFDGAALAEAAMGSLLRDFGDGANGIAFSVGCNGRIASQTRDAYTHAFILFAAAHLYRLNGDARLLALADRIAGFIDAALTDKAAQGLFDRTPDPSAGKSQNPHMHLLEAYLALAEAAPDRDYLDRAAPLVELCQKRMVDPESGALSEIFAQDWSRHDHAAQNAVVEPGHQFEWAWLLREYHALSGRPQDVWVDRLYSVGRRGLTAEGLIWDQLDGSLAVSKRAHRLWPHTEAIKAAAMRHGRGDPSALNEARDFAAALSRHFLAGPFDGGWIDQIDAQGRALVDYVPASSLYHLFLAGAEADASFSLSDNDHTGEADAAAAMPNRTHLAGSL